MDAPTFTIGGPVRFLIGLVIAITAGLLIHVGRGLDWGLAWICFVPAAVLILPAITLVRRTRLVPEVNGITIETGWLFRRGWLFSLADASLEFVETAGLWAVILCRNGNRIPLATWVRRSTAERLAAWLDAVAGMPLPRAEAEKPRGDR